jgi:hypothetical protein
MQRHAYGTTGPSRASLKAVVPVETLEKGGEMTTIGGNSTPEPISGVPATGAVGTNEESDDLNLKKGDVDSSGNTVARIFSKEPGRYVIYETTDHEVKVRGTNVSLAHHPKITQLMSKLGDLTTHSRSLPTKYNSSMAHAMKILLDGDAEASYLSLLTTFRDMKRFLSRGAKFAYLSGASALMIVSFIAYVIAYKVGISSFLTARMFDAAVAASMGGFLSVAIGTESLKIDLQDGYTVNIGYGAMRILMAIISGVVTLFLIESRLILPSLKDAPENSGLVIAAFLSGFSEKLIPNLLRKIEDTSDRDKDQ